MVLLIQSVFSGPAANGGGVSTLAFSNPSGQEEAEGYADELSTFWSNMCATVLSPDITVQVSSDGAIYASSDGSLQQVYDLGTQASHSGTLTAISVPRSAQALLQFTTSGIVNNRRVRGRMFIPGLPAGSSNGGGGLLQAYRDNISGYFNDFLDAVGNTMVVWSRPKTTAPTRAGSEHEVTSIDVWGEFAVLRSRRD